MSLDYLLINAILFGALYASIAYGLSIIYGVMKVVNLAHGGTLMLGAYAAYTLFAWQHIDPILSLLIVLPVFFVLGVLIQKFLVEKIMDAPQIASLLLLFGVWLLMKNLAYLVWSGDEVGYNLSYSLKTVKIFVPVSIPRIIIFSVSIITTVLLLLFLKKSYLGKAMRALSQNRDACSLVGIPVERVAEITFGLGTALAALGGTLASMIYSFSPEFGSNFLLKSFCIIVLGGMESTLGVIVGALLLSLIESFSILIIPIDLQEMISFVLLVLILVIKPTGIFGRRATI